MDILLHEFNMQKRTLLCIRVTGKFQLTKGYKQRNDCNGITVKERCKSITIYQSIGYCFKSMGSVLSANVL